MAKLKAMKDGSPSPAAIPSRATVLNRSRFLLKHQWDHVGFDGHGTRRDSHKEYAHAIALSRSC
eukprot:4770364-Amphidinium_carterae.1